MMANGSEPSGAGLVILTGLSIAAVVGLYAYDAIPRRSGPAPSSEISWLKWQSDPSYDRSYDTAPQPQPTQSTPPPAQETQATGPRYQRYPAPPQQQGAKPQQRGRNPQPPQPDNYPQDVPDENGAPTQQR